MKTLIIQLLLWSGIVFASHAQTINFTYDDSGSRKTRTIVELRSSFLSLDSLEDKSVDSKGGDNIFEEPIVDNSLKGLSVVIYPNPTKGHLKVKVSGNMPEKKYKLTLYNMKGKLLLKHSKNLSNESLLDLSEFPNAIYLLELSIDKMQQVYKIIKE